MSSSDPTPGTERRNVIFNLVMFSLTGSITLVYSWTFMEHVLRGLKTSLTDELLGCAIICSSVFYGRALAQSYKAYVRTYGPSFSIGPFTILNTSLLPSSSTTSIAPPTPMVTQIGGTPQATFPEYRAFTPNMDTPGMMFDTPRQSTDLVVCPPTPDSIASNQTPILVTPSMDNNNNAVLTTKRDNARSLSDSTPSRSSSRASQHKFRMAGALRGDVGGVTGWEDMEKGEMFGLGMGDIGGRADEGEESRTVRP